MIQNKTINPELVLIQSNDTDSDLTLLLSCLRFGRSEIHFIGEPDKKIIETCQNDGTTLVVHKKLSDVVVGDRTVVFSADKSIEIDKTSFDEKKKRWKQALTEDVAQALNDPSIVEIILNADGSLWFRELEKNNMFQKGKIKKPQTFLILKTFAALKNKALNENHPFLEGCLTVGQTKIKFTGVIPPLTSNPTFSIGKLQPDPANSQDQN